MKIETGIIVAVFLLAKAGTAQDTSLTPVGRGQHAACFDNERHLMLVFGGAQHGRSAARQAVDNSLWGWNSNGWKLLSRTGPSAREDAKMGFHDADRVAYMYGGRTYDSSGKPQVMDDLWSWDGKTWKLLVAHAQPGKRIHANMAYDKLRNTIVLFGGAMFEGEFTNDLWEWHAGKWKKIDFSDGPAPRLAHAQTYSSALKRTLIIGGINNKGETLHDVWAWDGKEFELLDNNVPAVEVGQGNAVSIDENNAVKLLLCGRPAAMAEVKRMKGNDYVNGSWLWNGKNWTKVSSVLSPSLRELHMLLYDQKNKQAILFGGSGRQESAFASPDDTWLFKKGKWKPAAKK